MKLSVVCNQNQARSQLLSSVFTTLLPNWKIISFGLIAREGTLLPLVIESVFNDWHLDSKDRFARNLYTHWDELKESDLVIAVTTFIAEELKVLGFRGEILDLELQAHRIGISVKDPQLMPRRQCAFELAKYLKVAISAIQGKGLIGKGPKILALLPENEIAIDKAIEIALANYSSDSSVLIGDLIAPRSAESLLTNKEISHFMVDEKSLLITTRASYGGAKIYLPQSASIWPSKVYLAKTWQNFILQIPTELLTIITPPLRNGTGMISESYLAALYADEVQVVRS